jgi:uncharacterized protein (DUF433 family)
MNADDFASKDIRVMRGAVVFKGTRVPLERIVNYTICHLKYWMLG